MLLTPVYIPSPGGGVGGVEGGGENIVASTQFLYYACRLSTLLTCLSEVFLAEHSYDIKIVILKTSGPNLPLEVG